MGGFVGLPLRTTPVYKELIAPLSPQNFNEI
jgi:hypothetical protein